MLPNRVEMRLKPSNKVIGYTLALVPDDDGEVVGAAMFFKDLTRVEQLEERERLRDRLAAVGEMAAVIAHEVKNPLAGIEVMAGLLRRKIPDAPDAQAVLTDIISEAKMANAIVQEVLDFVRPIRLQVEHTAVADAVQGAIQLADTKARAGRRRRRRSRSADGLPQIQADQHQLTQVFTNLLMNAYEAMDGTGRVTITARPTAARRRRRRARRRARGSRRRRPGDAAGRGGQGLRPVLHDEAAGLGAGARHRPEDRRRARRTDRPADGRRAGHDDSGDAAGDRRRRGLED